MKCGIEIHQRLCTEEKLFCKCNNALAENAHSGTVERKMRAVVGELGKVDPAAAFEASTNKTFVYQYFDSASCLVELDEAPPREVNKQALDMVLGIAKALNATVVDEVYVMRKQVVDGSATSGFQRTSLIAINGYLQTSQGKVEIPTVCLEEESSGIVDKTGEKVIYRVDRLGMPLIEIATAPTIKNGSHCREVAEKIGMLLRASGVAARGIGSIRQDLNVSVEGGARVEIKGAQELADVEALVENEAKRQEELKKLKGKGIASNEFAVKNASSIFSHVKTPFITKALDEGKVALACKVAKAKGVLGREILPSHRVGTEASDYAKAKAGVKGIIHSDEDPSKYGATQSEWNALSDYLDCSEGDGWIACVESGEVARNALCAAFEKLASYDAGLPKETRRAEGVISKYMRPLPGSARMYPETDVPPVKITEEMLAKIKKPETFEEKIARFEKMGLGKDLAEKAARSPEAQTFEKLAKKHDSTLVAVTLLETVKTLKRDGVKEPTEKQISETLDLYAQKQITKAAISEVLKKSVQENKPPLKVITEHGLSRKTGSELKKLVDNALSTTPDKNAAFAKIMREHRLVVDAGELKEELG